MQIKFVLIIFFFFFLSNQANTRQPMNTDTLDDKQQAIIAVSAFTAKGDVASLKPSLKEALDAGLPINDIKEIMVQLYAYAGFPRSLTALTTLMAVIKERREKGISDHQGKEANPLPVGKNKLQLGSELQTALIGQPAKADVYAFAPAIDQFLKEHLFGDIFGRDNLDWKTRELATISALAAMGGVEAQLRSHISIGLYNGLTGRQLQQLVAIIQNKVSSDEGRAAGNVVQTVLQQRQLPASNEAVTGKNETGLPTREGLIIRIAEIDIYPQYWEAYKTILKEAAATSVGAEPGVIAIFPMFEKADPTQVRIVEIYAGKEAYEAHLKTPHFQTYKTTTLNMVKSLRLADMNAIDAAGMRAIFYKLKQ